ncbi:MAG: alpha/beta hydrolase, partial [Bacillota bacterium]
RIQVCVDICSLTDFDALIESRALDGHGVYFYVPSLLKHFTAAEINALIAPRPHLSLAGKYDRLVPASGLDRIEAFLRDVYAACERPHAWRLVRFGVGHVETHAMRRLAVDFLREWL